MYNVYKMTRRYRDDLFYSKLYNTCLIIIFFLKWYSILLNHDMYAVNKLKLFILHMYTKQLCFENLKNWPRYSLTNCYNCRVVNCWAVLMSQINFVHTKSNEINLKILKISNGYINILKITRMFWKLYHSLHKYSVKMVDFYDNF